MQYCQLGADFFCNISHACASVCADADNRIGFELRKVYSMAVNSPESGKFAEELYFLLMSSTLRRRIHALAAKHGLSPKAMRNEIITCGNHMGERADFSLKETVYVPRQEAG